MSTRIFVRALHSTRSVLNAGSAAPKAPAPKTAAQLGFSGERRKRELPSLDKPARPAGERSGNNNGNRNNGNRNGPRPPRGPRPEGQQGPCKPREPRERQERPREKVQAVAEGVAAQATEVEAGAAVVAEGAEHTASRKANASLVDLDAEFFEGAQPAVASASSSRSIQRQNQNQRKASERTRFQSGSRPAGARGPRTGNRNGPNNGPNNNNARPARAGDRGPRPPMRAEKAAFIKSVTPFDPKTQVQRDTSMAGLFGVGSILAPPSPRARDPQSSIWALAQGMDRAAAYKADTLRRLGAYEMMVPNAPVPTKDVKAAALANAAWVMGMHPSYSMYKAAKGLESIKKFM